MRTRPRSAALLALSLAITSSARGADLPNGWHVRFTSNVADAAAHAPAAALFLGDAETAHPELGLRGWKATYSGIVKLPLAGNWRFGVEADGGTAELYVRDASGREVARCSAPGQADLGPALTAWTALGAADVAIEVRFARAARGAARLRTHWELQPSAEAGFELEPIPTAAVRVPDSLAAAARAGRAAERGRLLLELKGCSNCHDPGPRGALAVARRAAPDLSDATVRAGSEWLARWIAAPAELKHGADMPRVLLDGASASDTATAIVHYLASRAGAKEPVQSSAADSGAAARGTRLFHVLGCAACHGAFAAPAAVFGDAVLPAAVPGVAAAVPYGELAGKWRRSELAAFLREPSRVHPDGRMPSLLLSEAEASDLAAALSARFAPEPAATPAVDAALAARGEAAYRSAGCAACHVLPGLQPPPAAKALAELDPARGCLADADASTPRYDLGAEERSLLAAGIESVRRAAGNAAPADACGRTFERLHCGACHPRDGLGGPADELKPYFISLDDRVDLGDEGRFAPALSGVGFKLATPWFHAVLERGARARPYIAARMPQFGSERVGALPEQFASLDGVRPNGDRAPPGSDDGAIQVGRRLASGDGMNCVSCHVFRDLPAIGSPGPSLSEFGERLRYEWWRAYLPQPARYKPGTRMPAFAAGRASTAFDVLDGDIYAQADALWAWFRLGEAMPAPPGLEAVARFELTPDERPIVFRTFIDEVSPRAIAVGLPQGIHFAFDAEGVRLAEAWKGAFIDAASAWAGRGGMPAGGRGPIAWRAPPGPALVAGAPPAEWPQATGRAGGLRFRGYRLDGAGLPSFLYDCGDLRVTERASGRLVPRAVIERSFAIEGLGDGAVVWLNAGAGATSISGAVDCAAESVAADGATWYRIIKTGPGPAVRFTLEIRP